MTLFEVVNVNEDRQIVYLSRDDIKKLGIEEKDTVKVYGRAGCAAAVVLSDNKMKDGRIGIGTLKESIGVGQGHTVRVSPVKFCGEAKKVLVRVFPARGISLKAVMLGKLIVDNQKLRVEEDGRITKIKVLKTDGDGCYIVKDTTEIEVVADKELSIPAVSLKDVGGLDDVIEKLRELVNASVLTPERFYAAGLRPPRGVLLYGPPGTGKTYFARAIAGTLGFNVITISAAELISKWIGESEENIIRVFRRARTYSPTVILFDEIDAIASRRVEHDYVGRRITTQLIAEMDGAKNLKDVLVIGTTNRIDIIDPALLRPGRFDLKIEIPPPNLKDRIEILKAYLKDRIAEDVLVVGLAQMMDGFSTAEIVHVITNAKLNAAKRGLERKINPNELKIEFEDFENAISALNRKE